MNKLKRKGKILAVIAVAVVISSIVAYVVLLPPPSEEIIYGEHYYRHFAENAETYFKKWGWTEEGEGAIYGNLTIARDMLNHSYYIYVIGHGGYYGIDIGDGTIISYMDVPDNRTPYNFVMLCSCGALSIIDNLTWEGELDDLGYKILVGYSGMGGDVGCWIYAYQWQNCFFRHLDNGDTFGEAYNKSINNYKMCKGTILIYGNLSLTVDDLTIPRWDVNQDAHVNVLDLIEIAQHWTG